MVLTEVTSNKPAPSLGPQCLACKRRQVKCDSHPLACHRCQNDGIGCPGYKKPLKWNHFEAPRKPGAKLHRVQSPSSLSDRSVETIRRNPKQNREMAMILDSVEYYNVYLATVPPAHAPFKRHFVPVELWPLVPAGLQYTLVVFSKANQCHKALSDPGLDPELVRYRGRSLSAIQKLLSDADQATKDPYAIALMSVVFIMGADMVLSEEHWTTHLEAARRIIFSRGGLQKVLDNPLVTPGPLVDWFYTDIISATACNAWSLNSLAVQSQFEYLTMIPDMEAQLVAAGHPCPQQILLAITYTNILRVRLLRPLTSEERRLLEAHPFTFETIRDMILDFDADIWALRISSQGRTLPEKPGEELEDLSVASFAWLGESFKSAALLFLYLSCRPAESTSPLLITAKHQLTNAIHNLFTNASVETDGPLYTRLWLFTIWPNFVSACAAAGLDIGGESLQVDFDRMKAIRMVFRAGQLENTERGVRVLRERFVKRQAQGEGGRGVCWDEGFGNRCAFVV